MSIGGALPSRALTPWNLTDANIRLAIIESRGDLFVASQLLGITALRLDRAIRASDGLQTLFLATQQTKTDPAFDSAASEAFEREVQRRVALYRVAGLDALHELATMPIDENSAQNQVKLAAAARLAGPNEGAGSGGDIAEALRYLNAQYHEHAPRIRVVRERTTLEIDAGEREIPVEHQPVPSTD